MKRGLVIGVTLFALVLVGVFVGIFSFTGFVVSSESVELVETSELVAGNGVCEYYYKQFDLGEEDVISINGEELNIKYLGENNWSLNEYKGKLRYSLEDHIQKPEFEGVSFWHSISENNKGTIFFKEYDYYSSDCLGYVEVIDSLDGVTSNHGRYNYEVEIAEGWNLVPGSSDSAIFHCPYNYNEICDDDVSNNYRYIPYVGEYYLEEDFTSFVDSYNVDNEDDVITVYNELLEDGGEDDVGLYLSVIRALFADSSSWIYVNPSSANKKFTDFSNYYKYDSDNSPRESFLNLPEGAEGYEIFLNTFEGGWNFLYVQPAMVFDDDLNFNPLTLNEITLDCNIEKAYLFDNIDKSWESIDSGEEFTEDMIGKGMIVKVAEDCKIGDNRESVSAPALPEEDFEYLIKEDIYPFVYSRFGHSKTFCELGSYNGNKCDTYEAEYFCSVDGLDEVEVEIEVYDRILKESEFEMFLSDVVEDEVMEESEVITFNGGDYYTFPLYDKTSICLIWIHENKFIAIMFHGLDDSVFDESLNGDFLELYFEKYPSTL